MQEDRWFTSKADFFISMPLFPYICTGDLRSFIFIWTMSGVKANFELCGSENFSKKHVVSQKFQEKLIFYKKSQWKF